MIETLIIIELVALGLGVYFSNQWQLGKLY